MPEEEHPVAALAREAQQNVGGVGEFFDSTERYFGPHDPEDWPRDLTRGELAGLIPQLKATVGDLSWTLTNILREEQQRITDPGKARLITEGIGLLDQACAKIEAGEGVFGPPDSRPPAKTPQDLAARSFPHGTLPGPAPGSAGQQPGAGPAGPANTASTGDQRRPRGRGV